MLRKPRRRPYIERAMDALQNLLDVRNFEQVLKKTSKKTWEKTFEIEGRNKKPEYILTVTVTTKKVGEAVNVKKKTD